MKNRQYFVFWEGDGGDSESHSAYYTVLVDALTKRDAIKKYLLSSNHEDDLTEEDYKNHEAILIDDTNHIK